jgi:hypothetical protein
MMEELVARQKRDPMSADLLRQRRNLLSTSLVLIAINLAGATLQKNVSVLGTSIEFSNPERIVWGVWVLWAYFFIRYWQYLNEEPDLGLHKGMGLWILERFPEDDLNTYSYYVGWQYGIFWTLYYEDNESSQEGWHPSKRKPQNAWIKAMWAIRAFTSVATKTPRFTDYVMPFFVAVIPLLLSVWNYLVTRTSATA